MNHEEFWENERRFWLEGEPHFRAMMAPDCVMVFPHPIGGLRGDAILDSLAQMPRWDDVDMAEATLSRISGDAVVLAYFAEGRRAGCEPYRVYCSSTYHRTDGGWRLIQHQHTPA